MKKAILVSLVLAAVLAVAVDSHADGKRYKRLSAGTFEMKSKSGIEYILGVPRGYNPSKGAPMILCLHGDGQFRDMNDFKNVWSTMVASATGAGFVCIAPKATGQNWAGQTKSLLALVDEVGETVNFRVRECIVIGHSSGASVAYQLALEDQKRFSAFGSMGGRLRIDQEAVKKAGNLGAYLFHFKGDTTVASSFSKTASEQLKAAGATVEFTEQQGGEHAIDYCVPAASKVMIPWFTQWVKKKARALADPGNDNNLPWGTTVGFFENLKDNMKLGLVYLYSDKDKEDKTAMWLRWEVFLDKDFQEAVSDFQCIKLDYTNESYDEILKELKVKDCALLIVDRDKEVVKKYTRPTDLDKLLKDIEKLKEQLEKEKEKEDK
jgi:predicted esterase